MTIDNTQDIIDTRDIIARIEELEAMLGNEEGTDEGWEGTDEEWNEFATLQFLMSDLKGNGGDEQWRGDWYPITLIRDLHFIDYAQELAEDCGMIPANAQWPNNCIDWVQAARELRMDYSCIEINRVSYWYR